MNNKFSKILLHPIETIKALRIRKLRKNANIFDDVTYINKTFKIYYHHKPNLFNPKTYQEKLQWLKLYDRNPLYTKLVDKYKVREFVSSTIGEEYLIPLLGVWDNPESIDFEKLPNEFVLKCNHNSGLGMCICLDKKQLNIKNVKDQLSLGLAQDYFLLGREWPYKNVRRKIICEQYICDLDRTELMDFKFFCFNGKFKFLLVCSDRHTKLANDWYDENLKHVKCINGPKNRKKPIVFPTNIKEMIVIAEKLSQGIPHVRVDLYSFNGKIFFGEMTFFESSGFLPFKPRKFDRILGDFLTLPEKYEE